MGVFSVSAGRYIETMYVNDVVLNVIFYDPWLAVVLV